MLVLTRLPNEAILIGDDIEITVLTIVGDTVRIRISCPRMEPPSERRRSGLDNSAQHQRKVEVRVVSCRPDDSVCDGASGAPRSIPITREEIRGTVLPQAGQSVIRSLSLKQLVVTVAFAGLPAAHLLIKRRIFGFVQRWVVPRAETTFSSIITEPISWPEEQGELARSSPWVTQLAWRLKMLSRNSLAIDKVLGDTRVPRPGPGARPSSRIGAVSRPHRELPSQGPRPAGLKRPANEMR